ncbi:pickpocket protein 28-like isoform X2 [Photinus pyralis]|uniref:pickpocket protein 28-like isoform X2 n=1 Tax=Photinus pyralis TaxID=7054 RepID=UPI0012677291|nr:pickpocket protein 28-like isoform X2 [Photinus pyralis]
MSNYEREVILARNNEGKVNSTTRRKLKKLQDDEETPFKDSSTLKVKTFPFVRKEPTCGKNTLNYFCEFCDNTSIHGFKFLGERKRYIPEKIWWMSVILIALSSSSALIRKSYYKWQTSPVVVTFATSETPIWDIPFPAITICPEVNAHPKVFNYSDVYLKYRREENTTEEEDTYFKLYSTICNERLEFIDQNATKLMTDDEFSMFLGSFADLQAEHCKWLGEDLNCDDSFSYILTSEGWCRTFNMLPPNEVYTDPGELSENSTDEEELWSFDGGYPPGAGFNTHPRRTMLTGVKAGLQLDLFTDDDNLDYLCNEISGFMVTLHNPAEVPNMDTHFRVPMDTAVVVAIKPSMISTSDEIKSYSLDDRLCYLPGERQLSNYKIYTQQNCMVECLANYSLKVCGCAGFYMLSNEEVTPVCGAGSRKCLEEARVSFLDNDFLSEHVNQSKKCNCLPTCTSLTFDAEVSQTEWNWRKTYHFKEHDQNFNITYERDHFSRLIVYYKNLQFMTSERNELYGLFDFLANCGGFLGLLCGFSFTSLMEIIYFLTLRFVCNLIKFGTRIWSGNEDMMEKDRQQQIAMEELLNHH